MNYNNDNQPGLAAVIISTGVVTKPTAPWPSLSGVVTPGAITLGTGTYYIPLGAEMSQVPGHTALLAAHLAWDANFRATITVEASIFPGTPTNKGFGAIDVSDYDAAAGNWIPLGTANGRCDAVAATATGLSVATITGQGGALWQLSDFGGERARLKLVVATGGVVRARCRGKYGS